MDKVGFVKMLAESECEFTVQSGEVIIHYDNHEAVFTFNQDNSMRDTWIRSRYGAAI